MATLTSSSKFSVFVLIWFGQLVSLIGSGLTRFALGIWVYQRTGSVTQFGLILLFTTLPGILLSPVAGALIDRWPRRFCMILSDSGAALSTLVIALLLFTGKLEIWHIYLASAVSSAFNAFQWPAYAAATTLLVPKQLLGRANGMVEAAEAAAEILSPAIAGVLIATIKIQGIIFIDFATFIFSVITLLCVHFPEVRTISEGEAKKEPLLREAAFGWTYITARSGLLALLVFIAVVNFLTGVVNVLVTPLVLAFAPVTVLGSVMSVGGSGMLIGSLLMSIWGGVKRPIYAVLSFTLLGGLSIMFAGLRPSIPVFFVTAFLYFFGLPIINASGQVIWQKKVAPDIQGRVFAVRRMIAWGALPLAYLLAGPLADRVFNPLLVANGPLAASIGRIIGVGPGYGIALLFVVMGTLTVFAAIAGYFYPRLRFVEEELPDAQ
ncbi:MFS transporter [Nostoc minutum NIES-26]|uniref:MFS transporter n=1 Tax=Nostoc minutum NIES-26 TaxID=1844469 RepID=A0A367QEY2_9NOSO|nr:MFS transporter [Nostoc minutum NIES-26]